MKRYTHMFRFREIYDDHFPTILLCQERKITCRSYLKRCTHTDTKIRIPESQNYNLSLTKQDMTKPKSIFRLL